MRPRGARRATTNQPSAVHAGSWLKPVDVLGRDTSPRSRPVVTHFSNWLHCRDYVWLQRHLHRCGQASWMRARGPEPTRSCCAVTLIDGVQHFSCAASNSDAAQTSCKHVAASADGTLAWSGQRGSKLTQHISLTKVRECTRIRCASCAASTGRSVCGSAR
jgi:hypothetical protein